MSEYGNFTYNGYQTNNHAVLYKHFPDRVAGKLEQYSDRIERITGENVFNTQTNGRGGGGRATVEIWYVPEDMEDNRTGTKPTQQYKKDIKRVFEDLQYERVVDTTSRQKFIYQGGTF